MRSEHSCATRANGDIDPDVILSRRQLGKNDAELNRLRPDRTACIGNDTRSVRVEGPRWVADACLRNEPHRNWSGWVERLTVKYVLTAGASGLSDGTSTALRKISWSVPPDRTSLGETSTETALSTSKLSRIGITLGFDSCVSSS